MDTFASVWDAADEVESDQHLATLTAARIQVAPVWSFLAKAESDQDFQHRFALIEEQVHAAAKARGTTFEALAKSLVEDYRALKAESAFYVEDGGEKVGGPYDTRSDAQDAIDGGDVSGDDLKVEGDSDGDGDTKEDEDDDADEGSDGDDSDTDEDDDDKDGEPSDSGNPFAKKESSLEEYLPVITLTAGHNVVHQPGETVFVDHFMGHDLHEGRKGVWAQVVSSPGTHGHEDRAESHLLKPMAPGGSHFFHHFGGLKTQANWGEMMTRESHPYEHGQDGWRSGLGSYSTPPEGEPTGSAWRPHRVYDSVSSAVNHLGGGDKDPSHFASYNHCNSCDHVYSTNHPDHVTHGHKDQCPNCNDTDFHETVADVLHESSHGDHDGAGEAHSEDNYGDPYGKMDRKVESSKTALADGVDPLQWIVETVPSQEGQAEAEAHHDTSVRMASLVDMFRTTQAQE